jgi:hypothetical protein
MIVAAVGFLGLIPLGIWDLRRRHRRAERALQQLSRRDFRAERAILSADERVLLAIDDGDRAAACELGRRGDVLVFRVARRGTFGVAATEDGRPFETTDGGQFDTTDVDSEPPSGRLVLELELGRKVVPFRFLDRIPLEPEGGKDWSDYAAARTMFVWWWDTLRDKQPQSASYKTPTSFMHRVCGRVHDEQLAEELGSELPTARVIERDR